MSYYLRFEAVNMGNFIYDTNDLSTIRGGGLSLLNAPEKLDKIIKEKLPGNYEAISKGASSALFKLDTNEETALDIKQEILAQLKAETIDNEPNPLRHATFVIDMLQQGNKFTEDRDSLLALNRWQQMQSPSVSIPKPAQQVCEKDKVRPGTETVFLKSDSSGKSEEKIYSASVASRRNFGREQKKGDFYKDVARLDSNLVFTDDFHELSNDSARGILNDKMAVIYLDGNKFGKVVGALNDAKKHGKFDKKLRKAQATILTKLLEAASTDESGLWKLGDKIRLETLLWGGDELIWVVPAWVGWFTLNFFYKQADEHMRSEDLRPKNYPSPNGKLSFAAGLVFCHYNAPIHRITRLAKNLAQIPKDLPAYQYKNTVAYQILESFDHAGVDEGALKTYRVKRLGNLGQAEHLLIAAEDMEKLEVHLQALKDNNFPRRKSYQIIKALTANVADQAKALSADPQKLYEHLEIKESYSEELKIKLRDTLKKLKVESLQNKLFDNYPEELKIQLQDALNTLSAECLQEKLLADSSKDQKTKLLAALNHLKKLCGNQNAHWLHLTDLWDYLALEAKDHA